MLSCLGAPYVDCMLRILHRGGYIHIVPGLLQVSEFGLKKTILPTSRLATGASSHVFSTTRRNGIRRQEY